MEPFADVDVAEAARWIGGIDLREWPQQVTKGIKPAMVTDLKWMGFGTIVAPIVERLMAFFPGCSHYQHMLSAVMPGDTIETHRDEQPPYWLTRVHVPLLTNREALFWVGNRSENLEAGKAYMINTRATHAVGNAGATPRIHFMFDVRTA